jgi:hypothetical protein
MARDGMILTVQIARLHVVMVNTCLDHAKAIHSQTYPVYHAKQDVLQVSTLMVCAMALAHRIQLIASPVQFVLPDYQHK